MKAEIISWFQIHEMFLFRSFHMYGVIGAAVLTGIVSIVVIKKFKIKTFSGDNIKIETKPYSKGNIFGGLIFGIGWAMTGACPGSLYALIGSGYMIAIPVFIAALLGTLVHEITKERLPH